MRFILGFRRPEHLFEHTLEFIEAGRGDDDVVMPAIDVLGDAQEPAARILTKGKDEGLALDLDLAGFEGALLGPGPGFRLPGEPTPGRITIVWCHTWITFGSHRLRFDGS